MVRLPRIASGAPTPGRAPAGGGGVSGGSGSSQQLLLAGTPRLGAGGEEWAWAGEAATTSPPRRLDFLHLQWVSRQYQILGHLLQRFPSPHLAPPPPPPTAMAAGAGAAAAAAAAAAEADSLVDPDHYLLNAAM